MKSSYLTASFYLLLLAGFIVSCEAEKEGNPHELIAGEHSKSWIASKEISVEEGEEKLSVAEERQELEFFTNGTFQMKKENRFHTGKWTYEGGNRELQLVFDEKPGLAEVFYVTRLEKDQLNVRAPDGGTMKLIAK